MHGKFLSPGAATSQAHSLFVFGSGVCNSQLQAICSMAHLQLLYTQAALYMRCVFTGIHTSAGLYAQDIGALLQLERDSQYIIRVHLPCNTYTVPVPH